MLGYTVDMQYQLLYPERRIVQGRQLVSWAQDYLVDRALEAGESDPPIPTLTIEEAADILDDAGLITLGNHGNPLDFPAQSDTL